MAASNLNLGKASGGVLNIQPADGTTTTSLILPAINGTVVAADSNGNVGIGTISPAAKLDVRGSIHYQNSQATYVGTIQINESDVTSLNQVGGLESKGSIYGVGYGTKILGTNDGMLLFGTRNNSSLFTERLRIDSNNGNVLVTSSGGLGYGTGAGGQVTQLTSKSTAVTLNKPTGFITMNNAALAAGASVIFGVNNNLFTSNDNVIFTGLGYSINYRIENTSSGGGTFYIRVTNITGSTLSEPIVFNFSIIKGATA